MRLESALLALFGTLGCTSEQEQIGVDELFRVRAASDKDPVPQFKSGPLPGLPPLKGMTMTMTPAPAADAGPPSGPPTVTEFATVGVAYQGQGSVSATGFASSNAVSVAIALEGISTGYWTLPVGALNSDKVPVRPWGVFCDFDPGIPTGYRNLLAVAIDDQNHAGRQKAAHVCIGSNVPDNFNSCTGKPPPFDVISLKWDANVDLDLQVATPDGRLIEPKHPLFTEPNDAGKLPTTVDGIDRDSNAACVVDNIRTENLVFRTAKPHGTFGIYVNMFDACKQPAVRFRVEVYGSTDLEDGGKGLKLLYPRPEDPQGGELLDISANGGAERGLFVTEFKFN
jgi:hypothetical protein